MLGIYNLDSNTSGVIEHDSNSVASVTEPAIAVTPEVVVVTSEKSIPTNDDPDKKKEYETDYSKAEFMSTESIGKVMWKLTYPSLIAKVASAMYAVCDSIFIGQMAGDSQDEKTIALAAISLAMPLEQGILHSIAMMTSNGGSTVYGQSVGEKNGKKGARTIGNTYAMEIVFAILCALIFPFISRPLLILLGASDEAGTLILGRNYVNTLFYGCICYFISMASADLIRGQGSAMFSCLVSITSAILNIIGDPIYIKVLNMGVTGAALSTVIANLFSGAIGFTYMRSKNSVIRWKWADFIPDFKLCGHILMTGMSGLVSGLAGAVVTIVSNRLVLMYTPYPAGDVHTTAILGAWGALSKVYFISFMPLIALAQGVLPMLAYSFGAKQHKRFTACAKLMLYWQIGITIVIEIVLMAAANPIAHMFSQEPLFIEFFVPALRFMVVGVFLQPFVMSVFPMLQAVGKGGLAGMLLAMKTCFILLILQLIISAMMQNYWGAVYAYPVTEVISAVLAISFYYCNRVSFHGPKELPIVVSS